MWRREEEEGKRWCGQDKALALLPASEWTSSFPQLHPGAGRLPSAEGKSARLWVQVCKCDRRHITVLLRTVALLDLSSLTRTLISRGEPMPGEHWDYWSKLRMQMSIFNLPVEPVHADRTMARRRSEKIENKKGIACATPLVEEGK